MLSRQQALEPKKTGIGGHGYWSFAIRVAGNEVVSCDVTRRGNEDGGIRVCPEQPGIVMATSSIAVLFSTLALVAFFAVSALTPNLAVASGTKFRSLHASRQLPTNVFHGQQVSEAVSETSERQDRLVVLFHGIRGRGSVMAAIADTWRSALPGTTFVAPNAPFPHTSGGYQWFAVDDQVLNPHRIQAARRAFDTLVKEIVMREGFEDRLDRVAFVGVSQGAIVALDAVTSGRWKVGALVSFAGLMPLPPSRSSSETPVLLLHGAADQTIPSSASVKAERQLKKAGYDVMVKVFQGVGHTISAEEARAAAAFLQERFGQ